MERARGRSLPRCGRKSVFSCQKCCWFLAEGAMDEGDRLMPERNAIGSLLWMWDGSGRHRRVLLSMFFVLFATATSARICSAIARVKIRIMKPEIGQAIRPAAPIWVNIAMGSPPS